MDTRATWDPWLEMQRLQREMEHLVADATPGRRGPPSGLRVRWPVISMATRSATPARTMLRAAVRRKSWNVRPARPAGIPAAVHAAAQAFRKRLIARLSPAIATA